jgi:ArsR family transcriptional regulator, arsenate/arsenite/antimonite-responsive transcriptional repressor
LQLAPHWHLKLFKIALYITNIFVTIFFVTKILAPAVFRALGDDTRWRILRLVMDQALCVCELADILEMPHSSVSSHVQIIRKAGLLESERVGKWTYFRIHPSHAALLNEIILNFPDHPDHKRDLKKTKTRLSNREISCCPGPIKLAKPSCCLTN